MKHLRAWVLYSCNFLHKTTHTYAPNHDHVHLQRSHFSCVVMINFPFFFSFRNLSCHLSWTYFFSLSSCCETKGYRNWSLWYYSSLLPISTFFYQHHQKGFWLAIFRPNVTQHTPQNTSILGVTLWGDGCLQFSELYTQTALAHSCFTFFSPGLVVCLRADLFSSPFLFCYFTLIDQFDEVSSTPIVERNNETKSKPP